jgi:hypothetical protein
LGHGLILVCLAPTKRPVAGYVASGLPFWSQGVKGLGGISSKFAGLSQFHDKAAEGG